MTIYALDTDTLSLYQKRHPAVEAHLLATPIDQVAITVMSIEEQLSGWYSQIRKAKSNAKLAWAYRRLAENTRFIRAFTIMDFTEAAIQRCEDLIRLKLNVRRSDLRIAAIALEHSAIVVTRNRSDFERVPGLQVEDWSR